MELSKMFGVERDTDFGVEGYESFRFNINTTVNGMDRLYYKHNDGCWIFAKSEMLTDIIHAAPTGIIHLPPPLTDEQREQLDQCTQEHISQAISYLDSDEWLQLFNQPDPSGINNLRIAVSTVLSAIMGMYSVPQPDPEPYDIGKALGVEGC